MLKKVVIVAALAVFAFGVYQLFNTNEVSKGTVTVAFTGIDMSCDQCTDKAETALSKIIGIQSSHINPAKDVIRVTFNAKMMKPEWIANSLKAAGFKAEDIEIMKE